MNVHTDAVFNTVLQNNRETIPFILDSISLGTELVHFQMEDIKQDIQDSTSDYLVCTPIPENNILSTADYTINYIKEFLQPHRSYSKSQTTQDHITTDIRAELSTTAFVATTASSPNTGSPTIPLSNSTEEPSTFISTRPPYKPS